jgi:hypothetical protein
VISDDGYTRRCLLRAIAFPIGGRIRSWIQVLLSLDSKGSCQQSGEEQSRGNDHVG